MAVRALSLGLEIGRGWGIGETLIQMLSQRVRRVVEDAHDSCNRHAFSLRNTHNTHTTTLCLWLVVVLKMAMSKGAVLV